MNKIFFVVIVGFLAVQNVESNPKNHPRSQPNAVQESDIGQTVVTKTKELIKNADEVLHGNLPDSKQIQKKLKETGETLVNNIEDFNNLIKKTLKDNEGKIDGTLKQISDNLKQARETLEKKVLGPEGENKVNEIREAVSKGIQDATKQITKLGSSFQPEAEKIKNDLLAGAKTFLDKAEEFTNDLKVHVADAQKPKK